jgi:hypothetical protein
MSATPPATAPAMTATLELSDPLFEPGGVSVTGAPLKFSIKELLAGLNTIGKLLFTTVVPPSMYPIETENSHEHQIHAKQSSQQIQHHPFILPPQTTNIS